MKALIKSWGFALITVLAVSIFPVAFLFSRNANEVNFSDVVPALLFFGCVGIIFLLIFGLMFRSADKAAITAVLFALLFVNFTHVETIILFLSPKLKYWHTVSIILLIGLHVVYLIWRFVPNRIAKDISHIVTIVFGVLIIINIVASVPQLVNKIQAEQRLTHESEETRTEVLSNSENPNIYIFGFDEYANFTQMEQGYSYDNAPLRKFFAENNFNVSYDSHNESIYSATVWTNLVNLDYIVTNNDSESDRGVIRQQGALFSLLREKGYNVQILETGTFFTRESPTRDQVVVAGAMTSGGENFYDICMEMTILYPFHSSDHAESMNSIHNIVGYVCEMEKPQTSTFTLAYLPFPHVPFLVDENGNSIPTGQSLNLRDDKYYLGQYIYATKLMIQMMESVLSKDPDAVIMVCSDHGMRATTDPELFLEGKFSYEFASNPLMAVYFQGKPLPEIENQSGVNTVRIILNSLWDTGFEILEVPKDTYKYK